MKSPIRSSKTAAPVTATKNPGKMVLGNVAYSASKKNASFKGDTTEKSSDKEATTKKK